MKKSLTNLDDILNYFCFCIGPGAAPSNIKATEITENSLLLQWDPIPTDLLPLGNTFDGYKIFYNEEGGKQKVYQPELIKNTSCRIKNLKKSTKYNFALAGVSKDVVGPVSKKVEVTTAQGMLII